MLNDFSRESVGSTSAADKSTEIDALNEVPPFRPFTLKLAKGRLFLCYVDKTN
ncbi:MAG: hypothetical protein HWD61_09780 [Parachlamydiaceae bacterium]|nr:MAG: hypothetical protein HWD61_09780 [Parachlamydiaceae bacterium]